MQKLKANAKIKNNKYAILLIILALILVALIYYAIIWQISAPDKKTEDKATAESQIESLTKPQSLPILAKSYNLESRLIDSEDRSKSHIQPNTLEDLKSVNFNYDKEKLQAYQLFLFSINILVVNFFQDKVYTEQINQINKVKLPENIKAIFDNLNEYNTKFLMNPTNYQQRRIFPLNTKLIEKFIKIEQESSNFKEKRDLRADIIKNLEHFITFCYSDKLQQKFIE